MSYSMSNVLAEAGLANIMRWVPVHDRRADAAQPHQEQDDPTHDHSADARRAADRTGDRARSACGWRLIHHKSLATGLKGVQQERTISDVFEQQTSGKTLIDMLKLDLIVGSGGILSHAPRRIQSMLMMVDAYEPIGRHDDCPSTASS